MTRDVTYDVPGESSLLSKLDTLNLDTTSQHAFEVMQLARKYQVRRLELLCMQAVPSATPTLPWSALLTLRRRAPRHSTAPWSAWLIGVIGLNARYSRSLVAQFQHASLCGPTYYLLR